MIGQLQLKSKFIKALDGMEEARYVFPFFDRKLNIAFFMIDLRSDELIITKSFPQLIEKKVIEFTGLLRPDAVTEKTDINKLHGTAHFDPWWSVKKRNDIPHKLKRAIMNTNIADKQIGWNMVRDVIFADDLQTVEGFMIGDGVFKSSFYSKMDILSKNDNLLKLID